VQSAFAMTGGGGLDIRLTHHFSIRAVQAEYMMTRFANVTTNASASQNDLRLSSGILIGFGGGRAELPLQLACSVQPQSGLAGDPMTVTATATNLRLKRKTSYSWSASGGVVTGSDGTAGLNTAGLAPGEYTVSGHVMQGDRVEQQASCTAGFTIQVPPPPPLPTIACSASPMTVTTGDVSTITAVGSAPGRTLSYSYTSTAGSIAGAGSTATLSTGGAAPGTIHVLCSVVDDLGRTAVASTSVMVTAPTVAAAPQTSELCGISFDRNAKKPVRVDNEAKACLDDVASQMQRESAGRLVVVGNYADGETPKMGAERALNVRKYLTEEKGLDAGRIDVRVGTASGRSVTDTFVPLGATYVVGDTTVVDPKLDPSRDAYGKPRQ